MKTMWRLIRILLWLCILTASGLGLSVSATLLYLAPKLPNAEILRNIKLQTPLRIYSKDHQLIAEFGEKRREPIQFDDIPPLFINAILAAEDQRFFEHNGVDVKGIGRAVLELVSSGHKQSGGSTVTMQVARNFFLSRDQTYIRKFNEIILALLIERAYTKHEILNLYVNKIFLGHRSYGIGAAAHTYYGRPIQQLSLPELAMIAGLPKAPSRYNPFANSERALQRRNWILNRMNTLGFINDAAYQSAINSPNTAKKQSSRGISAPYIAEMVRQGLTQQFGDSLYEDGYVVHTTINADLQIKAQKSIQAGLQAYDQRQQQYRGPEGKTQINLPPHFIETLNSSLHSANTQTDNTAITATLSQIDSALGAFYTIGDLTPALVISVAEDHAVAITQSHQLYHIPIDPFPWKKGSLQQRRITKPEDMSRILTIGDIIRISLPNEIAAKSQPSARVVFPQARLTQIPSAQAALIAISPIDGSIQSMVGGFDFRLSKFNRATQAKRQVGSSIKPFIYAAALHAGFTAASIINDAPLVFHDPLLEQSWRPQNAGGKFYGPTRLRKALYRSRNLVSVRLLKHIGTPNAINYLGSLGFPKDLLPNNLSLALGSANLIPLDIARAFSLFANDGFLITPYLIDSITNANGETIFQANPPIACKDCDPSLNTKTLAPRLMDERIAFIMHTMLQDVIQKGTGRKAKALNRSDIGGKTGTTNENKDAWFTGYSPTMTTSVWVGYDDPKSLGRNEFGGTAALPIWIDYMKAALAGTKPIPNVPPEKVVSVLIDKKTGKPTTADNSNSIFEWFREELAPNQAPSKQDSGEGEDSRKTPPRESVPNIQQIF